MTKPVWRSWASSWRSVPKAVWLYVVFGLFLLLAVGFWVASVSRFDSFVAVRENQATTDAATLGYDSTPFIKLVATEVSLARLQWFLLELTLIAIAFLIARELALIRAQLWEGRSEGSHGEATSSSRRQWNFLLTTLVPILVCVAPFLAAGALALPREMSLFAAVVAAPEPVSRFGQDFNALVSPSELHPGNAFLFPFCALVLVHWPLQWLRRAIGVALDKGVIKVDLDKLAALQKAQAATTGLTSGSQSG